MKRAFGLFLYLYLSFCLSLEVLCLPQARALASEAESPRLEVGRKWAFCIGIGDYEDPAILDLPKARNDAQGLARVLLDRGGFHHVSVFSDDLDRRDPLFASRRNILNTLRRRAAEIEPQDLVLFSFSGHGLTEASGRAYLLTADSRLSRVAATGLPVDEVVDFLSRTGVQKSLLLIDAARENLTRKGQGGHLGVYPDRYLRQGVTALFYSAKRGRFSADHGGSDFGVFSEYLIRGLEGDADRQYGGNQDGAVTLEELSGYLIRAMGRWSLENAGHQSPYVKILEGRLGGLVLSSVPAPESGEGTADLGVPEREERISLAEEAEGPPDLQPVEPEAEAAIRREVPAVREERAAPRDAGPPEEEERPARDAWSSAARPAPAAGGAAGMTQAAGPSEPPPSRIGEILEWQGSEGVPEAEPVPAAPSEGPERPAAQGGTGLEPDRPATAEITTPPPAGAPAPSLDELVKAEESEPEAEGKDGTGTEEAAVAEILRDLESSAPDPGATAAPADEIAALDALQPSIEERSGEGGPQMEAPGIPDEPLAAAEEGAAPAPGEAVPDGTPLSAPGVEVGTPSEPLAAAGPPAEPQEAGTAPATVGEMAPSLEEIMGQETRPGPAPETGQEGPGAVEAEDTAEALEVASLPEKERFTPVSLRGEPQDLSPTDVKEMLQKHAFYATCWNYNGDFCNPEGDFRNGFVDRKDGTVLDEATGLLWQKSGSTETMAWTQAADYVKAINAQGLGGYQDWRLPTAEELASLMESVWRNGDLFIDPLFDRTQRYCWSADTQGSGRAWKANFHLGFLLDFPVSSLNSVRVVRSAAFE